MSAEGIKVCVRVRPFNKREEAEADNGGLEKAFSIVPPATIEVQSLAFQNAGEVGGGEKNDDFGLKKFGYDFVFSSEPEQTRVFATQVTVYEAVGLPLLDNALNAYNATMFAYGQTGAGKSHSVLGAPKDPEQKGILPRSTEKLFELFAEEKAKNSTYTATCTCSYLEIYNENLSDLLDTKQNGKKLDVRLHPQLGPHVPGLTEAPCASFDDINALLDFGGGNRIIAATAMNAQSSRSHAVFTVALNITKMGVESQSYIHFVDLAGSERQKKTGASGDRLKEGIAINQSLTALGRVIAILTAGKKGQVPPFRESKLTLLLKEALSGNSKTTMVAAVSPSLFNIEETISTLEFAARCKTIKTSAKKNEVDRKDLIESLEKEKAAIEAQLKSEQEAREQVMKLVNQEREGREQMQKEMEELQAQLLRGKEIEEQMASLQASGGGGGGGGGGGISDEQLAQIEAEKEALRLEHEREKALMSQADDANKAQIEAHLLQLEAEMAEKEALAMERELAMAMVAEEQAEKARMIEEQEAEKQKQFAEKKRFWEEREQIEADRRRVELELEANRAALMKSEEANRAELEGAIKLLEDEQKEKESLAAQREHAMQQAKAAEEERDQIENERKEAEKRLEQERKRYADADEAKKKEMEDALKLLEEEQAEKQKLAKERSEALELVANAEREKARVQAEIEAEKLRAKQELEEERKRLAASSEANKKDIEEAIKKLQAVQAAKEELDRERVEALNKAAHAEQERLEIQRQRELQAQELQQERQKLAEASEENKKEVEAKIAQLEAERKEKESMAQERTEALAQVAKAEQERARIQAEIQAERERAQAELEKERAKLAQAEGAGKAEIEKAMQRLEEEQKAKEALSRERAAALDKVAHAEEERAQIQKEREDAQKALEEERKKLKEADEAAKEEIASAVRRLEQEQEQKSQLASERAAALEQVANAERERAQIQAERDRMQRELQEERVKLMDLHGSNDSAAQEAFKKLEEEQAERARISKEREEALEKVSQAEKERAQIKEDKEKAIQERLALEAKLASADEEAKKQIEDTLKKLQEAQIDKDKAAKEREEMLQKMAKEQAEKEDILQQKAEEKAKAEKEAELRRKIEEEKKQAMKDKEAKQAEIERLQKEKLNQEAKESELKKKFEELEKKAREAEEANADKIKIEAAMEQRMKDEAAREEEMQARISDLQSRLESQSHNEAWAKDADNKFKEEMKKAQDSKSGAGNLTAEEKENCPFITKLTTEGTQGIAWSVFIDPKETSGVTLGSDANKAKIQIGGMGINAMHCRLWARSDCKEVFVQAEEGAIMRVNGEVLPPGKEKQVRDGDRISLGRSAANASFFEVEIPKARNHGLRDQKAKEEDDLLKAMEEVENSIELDDKTKEVVETAISFVKQKFGTQEANNFLEMSKRASGELVEANEILQGINEEFRGGVEEYELAVLFSTGGFPILSVIARKRPEPQRMTNTTSRVSRRVSGSGNLFANVDATVSNSWTLAFFREEILPWLREAQFSISQEEPIVDDDEEEEGWDWRLQVWSDAPMKIYKKVYENMNKLKKKANRSAAHRDHDVEEERGDTVLPWWLGGDTNTKQESKPAWSWGGLLGSMLSGGQNDQPASKNQTAKASIKQFTKGMIKATTGKEQIKTAHEKVTVPKLLEGGKLGVKLKNGINVVGFDHADAKAFGWALHDVIVEVNGTPVTNRDTFATEYTKARKTMPIVFTVQREIKPAKRKPSVVADNHKKKDDGASSSALASPDSQAKSTPKAKQGASSSAGGKGTKFAFDALKTPNATARKESKGMKEGVAEDTSMLQDDIPIPLLEAKE